MSRCFPYPPPGYEKSLALIESIKLQKEKEKKAEKEKKKREKKEKKDKSKRDERSKPEEKSKKRRRDESAYNPTDTKLRPAEDLERSSLTEELGSAAVPQVLYDSSDGNTHDCGKRVISSEAPCAAAPATSSQSNGIRIRLPLVRHSSKSAESPTSGEQPCFSGRTAAADTPVPCISRLVERDAIAPPLKGESSKRKKSSSSSSGSSSLHRQYKKLVQDWVPPPPVAEATMEEDLDWLLAGRGGADRCRGMPTPVYSLQPGKAVFAPELGVHLLPYVVPF
ncbi:uncharacterized protein LOC144711620 [Wolffia australiana]